MSLHERHATDQARELLALGSITRELETSLVQVCPDEQLAEKTWERFDQTYFEARPDYNLWRRLQSPSFWRRGKKPFLQPRSTRVYQIRTESAEETTLVVAPSLVRLRSGPAVVWKGLVGSLVDLNYQLKRSIRRQVDESNSGSRGAISVEFRAAVSFEQGDELSFFETATGYLAEEGFTNRPIEAFLFLCLLGLLSRRSLPARTDNEQSLIAALQALDPEFDLFLRSDRHLPRISPSIHFEPDQWYRLIPTTSEDQWQILQQSLSLVSHQVKGWAAQSMRDSHPYSDLLRLHAALRSALVGIATTRRAGIQRVRGSPKARNVEDSDAYAERSQAFLIFSAAYAAELAGARFLAAKLWSYYIFLWDPDGGIYPPPTHCYRLVKEAGLKTFEKTPHPWSSTTKHSPPKEWSIDALHHKLLIGTYADTIARCKEHWDEIAAAVGARESTPPWRILGNLNGLVKDASPDRALEPSLAAAGFEVAMAFDKVELAHDFLQRIPFPSGSHINEFLHKVRMSLQWGNEQADPRYLEQWLRAAELAIDRSPTFGRLSDRNRLYCHEVLLGRFVKLRSQHSANTRDYLSARLGGELTNSVLEEMVRKNLTAIRTGTGEITLLDLRRRLHQMSIGGEFPVIGVSLIVGADSVSYLLILPGQHTASRTDRHYMGGVYVHSHLKDRLDELIAGRDSFSFDGLRWSSAVPWPGELQELFSDLLETANSELGESPGHIILTVNSPYNTLPWQHLVSCAHSKTSMADYIGAATISQLANFGALKQPSVTPDAPGLTCFPPPTRGIRDPDVRETVAELSADLNRFAARPRYSLAVVIGHGAVVDLETSHRQVQLPQIEIDSGETLSDRELRDVLTRQVIFLGSCGVGAPGTSFFGDVGGVLCEFLSQSGGLLFAPVAEISPEATVSLGREILRSTSTLDVMRGYFRAIKSRNECFLFNAWGVPFS